jgi:hypothetical protein
MEKPETTETIEEGHLRDAIRQTFNVYTEYLGVKNRFFKIALKSSVGSLWYNNPNLFDKLETKSREKGLLETDQQLLGIDFDGEKWTLTGKYDQRPPKKPVYLELDKLKKAFLGLSPQVNSKTT